MLLHDTRHGPLPALLLVLTVVTGLVDAVSILSLGRVQNAVVRALTVPDLTTTVLTMTLTGLAADRRGGMRASTLRRALAVAAMFAGALVGALLVLKVTPAAGLGAATALLMLVAVAAWKGNRSSQPWHQPAG